MNKINPLSVLVEEHKVILKMIKTLKVYGKNLKNKKNRTEIINQIIDFFRTFADKLHHGKEEDIFFKKLQEKPLKKEEKTILLELYEEHKKARELVAKLDELKTEKFSEVENVINEIVFLYKRHIEKENRRFFLPAFSYFSENEKKQMFNEFTEIDRKVLFKKYLEIAVSVEKKIKK